MVVERGSLSAINFLLAQGAAPKNYIREEYSAIVTHTLFRQHTTYQLKKIWREISSACRQKFRQEFLTKQSFFDRFITAAKEEKKPPHQRGSIQKILGCESIDTTETKHYSTFLLVTIDMMSSPK
tara:strand:- start:3640 stop:4014 length:375 start_codon:yes stop_codon:yes gene_type:complete